jgi:thiosulfate/3-mercaptopyruvate sulfurtransferase
MAIKSFPMPLVSTDWLASHVNDPNLKTIDATTFLPSAGRDARAEYQAAHIPGALFCDFAAIHDESAPFPHTLPSAASFGAAIGAMGVANGDAIVVYDSSGQNFSAPRLWWMFRVFGHAQVSVLDGGLKKWMAEGRTVTSLVPPVVPGHFAATFDAALDVTQVRTTADMRVNLADAREQVVDARSPGRFTGREPEPRAGVRSGHIPGSVNMHYATLVNPDGTLRPADELRTMAKSAGLDLTRPVVASCGSGVTACAVVLALTVAGAPSLAVYDGSWSEWGSIADNPVEVETP